MGDKQTRDPNVPIDPPREPVVDLIEYPLPDVPPEYVNAASDAVQRELARQAEQLAKPASNVDIVGMPHFLRVVDGVEVCGGCGQDFPCGVIEAKAAEARALEGLAPAADLLPTMTEAAAAAGMDLNEFEERLRQTRGL